MVLPAALRSEVVEFLISFKAAMDLGFFEFKGREKNMQGIMNLGLTIKQAKGVIAGLTPDNYVAGPKPDDTDASMNVWEFGTRLDGTEVYIKLRLSDDVSRKGVRHAFVWSFHPAEHPMKYPLRGGRP